MRTLTILFAMVAGFVGGAIGSSLRTVYAQAPGVEILHSRAFVLLDAAGRKRGEWTVTPSGEAVLRLLDPLGRVTWDTTGKHGSVIPISK